VIRVTLEDTAVCALCRVKLRLLAVLSSQDGRPTYLFLLFIHVTDLEPNILLGEWARWVGHNVFEALRKSVWIKDQSREETYVQALVELLLLLVNYAETEVDLVGLLEAWLHAHNLREGLFGMLEGPIAIIQDANAVPQLGFLCGN
jgi:hypothetical protein